VLIVQRPQIEEQVIADNRSKFIVEPLEPGFGYTLGNTLRRTLLSRIPGVAISSVRIEGVSHEFGTVPGVVEDVVDIILNLKQVVFSSEENVGAVAYVSASSAGAVTAGQITVPAGIEVVNKDLVIATLSKGASLEMELNVDAGVGYRVAKAAADQIGVIPIDALFGPVNQVSYTVEPTQVGMMTNYDRLVLDVQTNGAIDPSEALSSSGKTLGELLGLFADMGEGIGLELGDVEIADPSSPDLDLPIEALDLSERPRNCLRRSQVKTVGELVKMNDNELLNITNFGQKSLEEVIGKLDELGLSLAASADGDI
jgi:DNA-directed RNA polymerase subunit alpha